MEISEVERIQSAVQQVGFDGWLFCNFHHRDPLANSILAIKDGVTNSRYWFYAILASGECIKIVHAIEAAILDHLPGEKHIYSSRASLLDELKALSGKNLAMNVSEAISVISTVDYGTVSLVQSAGIKVKSAETLLQLFKGVLNAEGIASHERAANKLYDVIHETWSFITASYKNKKEITEGAILAYILDLFQKKGLTYDHKPIVACGAHAGDPHYETETPGRVLSVGDVLQLDIWAKENSSGSIYADISWVGFYGEKPTEEIRKNFSDLLRARDSGVEYLKTSFAAKKIVTGASVDRIVRQSLIDAGYSNELKHRTGHGIDTECHGSGANLDSVEFPDERTLLQGSCFSIEPGIYFANRGFRTEIDVYIHEGKPIVSGKEIQHELLTTE